MTVGDHTKPLTGKEAHKDPGAAPSQQRRHTCEGSYIGMNATCSRHRENRTNTRTHRQVKQEGQGESQAKVTGACRAWQAVPGSTQCLLGTVGSHWRVLSRRVI